MRVFVLSTGRCGSKTFLMACKHITNFTSGHESLSKELGEDRLNYPENHIEIDNRLSWFLGNLEKKYGDNAFYIHLIRDRDEVVNSFSRRWKAHHSIISAFAEGIHKYPSSKMSKSDKLRVCYDYYDTVNNNIEQFLKHKPNTLKVHLETIKKDFEKFYELIEAQGNLNAAISEFDTKYNVSKNNKPNLPYSLKLLVLNLFSR